MPKKLKVLLLAIMVCWQFAAAQRHQFYVEWVDSPVAKIKLPSRFADSSAAADYLPQLLKNLNALGYISASIDSVAANDSTTRAWIFAGKAYQWVNIEPDQWSKDTIAALGLNPFAETGKRKAGNIEQPQLWITYLANNGHPFAQVSIGQVEINEASGLISGLAHVDPGVVYLVDSIEQTGPLKLKPYFLPRYLNLPNQSLYNELKLAGTDNRLDALPFAAVRAPSKVQMLSSGAVLQVDLQKKRSNVINVLLGAMPNSSQTPGNQLQITGDVNLQLRNPFGNGEYLGFNWQQIQYKSPRITLQYDRPFVLQSKVGLSAYFELFRKDTQFLNLRYKAGIPILLSDNSTAHIFFTGWNTTVTYTDTNLVLNSYRLPDLANMSLNQLEAAYDYNATDYRINPRKGTRYLVSFAAGLKKIKPDNTILNLKDPNNPDFNFGSLYDTFSTNGYQMRAKFNAAHFLPVGNAATLMLGADAGWLLSNSYFRNELFQIGGFKLLRGFDEESIFARSYAIATVEYRLLTGRNGYFYGLANGGWSAMPNGAASQQNTYLAFGIGMNIETGNSLINLAVAAGKRDGESIDLRRTKIHLGIINYF